MRTHSLAMIVCLLLLNVAALAQPSSFTTLPLTDLSAFRPQAGNWQIVGDVSMDPNVDIHPPAAPPVEVNKKGKKSKPEPAPVHPQAVTSQVGTGILLNLNDEKKKDHLITIMEHGDIELELEVMLPKGSNSGIYLQGRYEVQLLDSWGVKNPSFSDIGGIYRNWEKEQSKSYMGKAPLSNPAKAPGLWQKMKISFRAPRFDASGNKIKNAQFVFVSINGVKIHDHVEVPLPTGGPIENNEKAIGPLMIQGDHGPVAFRNIQYQITNELNVSVSPISYKTYKGNFKEVAEFISAKPTKTGITDKLTCEVLEDEDGYGISYNGTLKIPADNTYQFFLSYTGGAVLKVNGQTLIDFQRPDAWQVDNGSIELKAGTYPFDIYNFKSASWMPPRMGFSVKTATSAAQELHSYNSYPPDDNPTSPILIHVGTEPRLLRAFVDFNGDRKKRITHSIGVGDPSGTHYVYDLDAGNVACVWRGDFVDATPMWHDRGDGSFKPLGAVQFLYMNQSLAFLSQPTDAFPATGKEGEFRSKGYRIEANGGPVFNYLYNGMEVEEKVYPDNENRVITREVLIKNKEGKTDLYFKLGEGSRIDPMPDGSYAIDDRHYYIKTAQRATIREVNGVKELVIPVVGNSIKYTIVW
jgi:Domain of Unknown Function (DUF1080)/PA14 domain